MSNVLDFRPSLLGRGVFDDLFLYRKDFKRLLQQSTEGYPITDIYDDESGNTILEFALAGFAKEELSIDIKPEDNSVVVKAASSSDASGTRRIARRSFEKTYVNYDSHLDLKRLSADYENGLLRLTIPPKEEARAISVKIK